MQHWPRLENKNRCLMRLFFRITQYSADAYNTHAYLPYPYEHLWITELTDLEIHEITTGASLSTGRHLPLKLWKYSAVKSWKNPEKYEHSCQVENLNPGGQVSPQETRPTDLWSVRDAWWDLLAEIRWDLLIRRDQMRH
jgi:hypothetical protein